MDKNNYILSFMIKPKMRECSCFYNIKIASQTLQFRITNYAFRIKREALATCTLATILLSQQVVSILPY